MKGDHEADYLLSQFHDQGTRSYEEYGGEEFRSETNPSNKDSSDDEKQTIKDLIQSFYQKHLLKIRREDDNVIYNVKRFNVLICVCLSCWLSSFVLIMLQIITNESAFKENWLCFLPLWLGSLVGLVGVVQVLLLACRPSSLVSRERRLYLKDHFPYQYQQRTFIEYQSLPIMRRLFCWSIILLLALSLLLFAQVCYYLWFVGVLSLTDSVTTIAIVLSVYLIYMYFVNIFNSTVVILFSLFILQLALFVMKETQAVNYSWIHLLLPLYLGLTLFLFHFSQIVYKSLIGSYLLTQKQTILLSGYAFSFVVVVVGTSLTLLDTYYQQNTHVSVAYICWTLAITVAGSCCISVLYSEGIENADRRGYTQPRILSRTTQGWDIMEEHTNPLLFLLGKVDIVKPITGFTQVCPQSANNNATSQKSSKAIFSYQQGKFLKKLRLKEKRELGPGEVELKSFQ